MRSRLSPFAAIAAGLIGFFLAAGAPPCAEAATSRTTAPLSVTGHASYTNGKAAADAAVTVAFLGMQDVAGRCVKLSGHADEHGNFAVPVPARTAGEPFYLAVVDVRSPSGEALLSAVKNLSSVPQLTKLAAVLHPFTAVRLHLVDETGRPVAGVRVSPRCFAIGDTFVQWDPLLPDRWTTVTDAGGNATMSALPQGAGLYLRLRGEDKSFIPPDLSQMVKLADAAATPEQTLHLVHGGTLSGRVVYAPTGKPAAKVAVQATLAAGGGATGAAMTDSQGRFTIHGMAAGIYTLQPSVDPTTGGAWYGATQPATIVAKSDTANIALALQPGGIVAGRVTDKRTGKPVPGAFLNLQTSVGSFNDFTDAAGRYSVAVAPGTVRVYLIGDPGMESAPDQQVQAAVDRTNTVNFLTTLPPPPIADLSGIVLTPAGKPAPGARVTALPGAQQEAAHITIADARGRFTFGNWLILPNQRLFAIYGRYATRAETTADAGGGKPVTLRLVKNAVCAIQGAVFDATSRKAVAGAKVMLFVELPDGTGTSADTFTTDAAGRYHIAVGYGAAKLMVDAGRKGYTTEFSKQFQAAPGRSLTLPAIAVQPTDSFVAGTIVDPSGKPVANAAVRLMSSSDAAQAVSDAHGRFRLAGTPSSHAIITAQAPDGRQASIEVASGRDDDVIEVENSDDQAADEKRFLALRASLAPNHGDGRDANALLRAAEASAGASGKKVLVDFYASWCGPCFLLHRFLIDPQVKPILDAHFVVQPIDIWEQQAGAPAAKAWENPGGAALYTRYAPGQNGVPFWTVLDAKGTVIGDCLINGQDMGYPSDAAGREAFVKVLKSAAPGLTQTEVDALKAGLERDGKV